MDLEVDCYCYVHPGNVAVSADVVFATGVLLCLLLLYSWTGVAGFVGGCWASVAAAISLSHLLVNAYIYVRFAFNMGGKNSTAGEPAPLYTDIIMTDVDKSTLLTREGVVNRHLYFTAITVMLYVKRYQVEEEAGIITSFLCREDVVI